MADEDLQRPEELFDVFVSCVYLRSVGLGVLTTHFSPVFLAGSVRRARFTPTCPNFLAGAGTAAKLETSGNRIEKLC